MIIDPPSPFAPEAEWREFLEHMKALASEQSRDAAFVRSCIKMAKQQLAIPLDAPRYRCPKCAQKTGVKIFYGYPADDIFEQAERQEVFLGGCMQEIGAPNRQCLACGHQCQNVRRKRIGVEAKS